MSIFGIFVTVLWVQADTFAPTFAQLGGGPENWPIEQVAHTRPFSHADQLSHEITSGVVQEHRLKTLLHLQGSTVVSQEAFLHEVAVIGEEGRVRSARTEYSESIGKVECYSSREAKLRGEKFIGRGTATIVAPGSQNHDRNFETITTAAHVLFGLYGNESRYCLFKPFGGRGEGEFVIKPQTAAPNVHLVGANRPQDYAIGVIETRLTTCEAESCLINSSNTRITNRIAKPLPAAVLSEENYNILLQPNASVSFEGATVVGYNSASNGLLEASSRSSGTSLLLGQRNDESCKIYAYDSPSVISHGCDIEVGASGGPFIGDIRRTVNGSRRVSSWNFGVQTSQVNRTSGSGLNKVAIGLRNYVRLHTPEDIEHIQRIHDMHGDPRSHD